MRYCLVTFLVAASLCASTTGAMCPSKEIIVPAAGRGGTWVTDLYVYNPSEDPVWVKIEWLARNTENRFPESRTIGLLGGETAVLDDVIFNKFGRDRGNGAFRITADAQVVANSRIYSVIDGATFGQGFPGVPEGSATPSGRRATIVGLSQDGSFRTNVYGVAGADGATVSLILKTPSGTSISLRTMDLGTYEPFLSPISDLMGDQTFDHATLVVEVIHGSAIVGASKVDEFSGDPTTLESTAPAGDTTTEGLYSFSLYDSELYSTGGMLVIADDTVGLVTATYNNWEKTDRWGEPACNWLWWLDAAVVGTLSEVQEDAVVWDADVGDGILRFAMAFILDENMGMVGALIAEGRSFSGELSGCNGEFPAQLLLGGKLRPDVDLFEKKKSLEDKLRKKLAAARVPD